MGSVKQILLDLGSFKPFVISSGIPESVEYPGVRERFSPGERVTLAPEVVGPTATAFKVDPPLPLNLRLNRDTGMISGQLKPHIDVPMTKYNITAGNHRGSIDLSISFRVTEPPPESIWYDIPEKIFIAEQYEFEAQVRGSPAREWSVDPELPLGLTLNAESGCISGVPAMPAEFMIYVSATNPGGTTTKGLFGGIRSIMMLAFSIPPKVSRWPSVRHHLFIYRILWTRTIHLQLAKSHGIATHFVQHVQCECMQCTHAALVGCAHVFFRHVPATQL